MKLKVILGLSIFLNASCNIGAKMISFINNLNDRAFVKIVFEKNEVRTISLSPQGTIDLETPNGVNITTIFWQDQMKGQWYKLTIKEQPKDINTSGMSVEQRDKYINQNKDTFNIKTDGNYESSFAGQGKAQEYNPPHPN